MNNQINTVSVSLTSEQLSSLFFPTVREVFNSVTESSLEAFFDWFIRNSDFNDSDFDSIVRFMKAHVLFTQDDEEVQDFMDEDVLHPELSRREYITSNDGSTVIVSY